jgi:hypothetical protein
MPCRVSPSGEAGISSLSDFMYASKGGALTPYEKLSILLTLIQILLALIPLLDEDR